MELKTICSKNHASDNDKDPCGKKYTKRVWEKKGFVKIEKIFLKKAVLLN